MRQTVGMGTSFNFEVQTETTVQAARSSTAKAQTLTLYGQVGPKRT